MKKFLISSMILGAFLTTACSKSGGSGAASGPVKETSVDKNGNCTEKFVADFNALNEQYKTAANSGGEKTQMTKLDGQCDGFFKTHLANIECNMTLNNRVTSMKTADIKTTCDDVKKQVGGNAAAPGAGGHGGGGFP